MAEPSQRPPSPVLELHDGRSQGARVVLVIRVLGHYRYGGSHAERIAGPWRDPEDAYLELSEIAEAQELGGPVLNDWAAVSGRDVAAAYLEQRTGRDR
jgi:hypothetical protein